MHLHFDPVGGVAGDMFAAALLDAFPQLLPELVPALRAGGLAADVEVRLVPVRDEVLAGARFVVDDPRERGNERPPHHAVLLHTRALHAHVRYSDIRASIERSSLPAGVVARALDIFAHLADAEAKVHGFSSVDEVAFHEVGAQDSIADVLAAAFLIEKSDARSFSIGSLPLGSGTVRTAHGVLPVPTPATVILLAGMRTHDDGVVGERVTPTGAAILRHLAPSARRPSGALRGAGTGWGSKRFGEVPNVLRALILDEDHALMRAHIARLAFEIDDQTAEDLAIGLERVRALSGVLDVVQAPVFGKKGRLATAVQVLCTPAVEDAVARACLLETTTLGVRVERIERVELAREPGVIDGVRFKRAERPDGSHTVKVESDDVAHLEGARARAAARAKGSA